MRVECRMGVFVIVELFSKEKIASSELWRGQGRTDPRRRDLFRNPRLSAIMI